MQQRRVRLGDILDDYCPRERRITNHAVVAMIEDEVKQTRCTTCDVDHEYKHAKGPSLRRKRPGELADSAAALEPADARAAAPDDSPVFEGASADADVSPDAAAVETEPAPDAGAAEEDGPVHRRLIRATLPRPDGQSPERREPDFTMRQPGVRGRPFDKNGPRHGHRQMRGPDSGQQSHFGAPRQGGSGQSSRQGSGYPPRHGSGQGSGGSGPGQRAGGNRPSHPGGPRGNRPGAGRGGRKRGR